MGRRWVYRQRGAGRGLATGTAIREPSGSLVLLQKPLAASFPVSPTRQRGTWISLAGVGLTVTRRANSEPKGAHLSYRLFIGRNRIRFGFPVFVSLVAPRKPNSISLVVCSPKRTSTGGLLGLFGFFSLLSNTASISNRVPDFTLIGAFN